MSRFLPIFISLGLLVFTACSQPMPTAELTELPTVEPTRTIISTPTEEPPPTPHPTQELAPVIETNLDEPVRITGDIEVTSNIIIEAYFFERFVMLQDLTGFVWRDYEYEQPLDAQILGPVIVDQEGNYTFVINLPAAPNNPLNDVDNNGQQDEGVQIWQVTMEANYIDDPFLGEDETGGWSANYTSARIDSENKDELNGGVLVLWAPDAEQHFPIGFGDDGLLFTEDDPVGPIPAGYTLVALDSEPFAFSKERTPTLTLYEGDVAVNDFSKMGWLEAFDALHQKVSLEYPFTELKDIDWDALYDEFAPRVEAAEAAEDETAYYLALRDFSWSIPDGHVGLSFGEFGQEMFSRETAGGYGFAIIGLDDGRVLAHILLDDGPAAKAGIQLGAEIIEWNGQQIEEALATVKPWSLPFSTYHSLRIQQYRYLLRDTLGTASTVTFLNPDSDAPTTATLEAVAERETFSRTSILSGFDPNRLPIEYEILPSGYGYIAVNSLSDDINLIIRLWEFALEIMSANDVPAIIIDMRQNFGGAPLGTGFASYFTTERIDVRRSYYFSEKTGEFETFGPPSYTEPDKDITYDGQVAVLVSPACSSACEDVAYVLGLLPQTRVFGFYPSNGIFGEVGRGQYQLPGGYSFQIPTGLSLDLEGNVIIEGTGVVPDVFVPLTEETVFAQFIDEEDVVLDFAVEVLNQPLGVGITPAHSPTIGSKEDAEAAFQTQTDFLEARAQEEYDDDELSLAGRTYIYTIPLNRSRDLMWLYVWCTADQESFEYNWSQIELVFALNDEAVPLDQFVRLEGVFGGNRCRVYYTVVGDWAVGEHLLTTTITFTEPLNDGIAEEDYPAGTHVYEYHVFVAR